MSEIVSLHIGSPGVQIGNKLWELFSIEQGFNQLNQLQSIQTQNKSKLSSFYSEHSSSFTPRALFIDNEVSLSSSLTFPGVSSLPSDNLILAEDSEGNYFKSYSSLACNDLIQEKVRRQVESCSSLQGFLIYSSTAGGLSGLASNILEHLGDDLPKNTKLGVTLFPSSEKNELNVYNFLASFGNYLKLLDGCFYLENNAVERIYKKVLTVENPGLKEINDLVAELVSYLTVSLRFDDYSQLQLSNYVSDYIPYPTIKYLISSIAPLINKSENKPDPHPADSSFISFSNDYLFSNTTIEHGKFLGASLAYQGNIMPKDICCSVASVKVKISKRVQFVDWAPTGFKCRLNNQVLPGLPSTLFRKSQKGVCMVANSSAIKENFFRLKMDFDEIWNQRKMVSRVYEYGAEEGSFNEWREELGNLCEDYLESEKEIEVDEVDDDKEG